MSDGLTVAWMLCLLATIAAELVGIATRWFALRNDWRTLQLFSGAMLFVALVAGFATVVLTGAVLRTRRTLPPRPIVVIALVSGCIPWLTLVLLAATR